MPRNRKGSLWQEKIRDPKTGKQKVFGLYGRITFIDDAGKRRDRKRKAISGTRTEAWQHVKDLLAELDQGQRSVDSARLTFNQLVDHYEENYLFEAEYDAKGNKIAGLRTWQDMKRKLSYARPFFGTKRIRDIRYADLVRFKTKRLRTPVHGRPRTIATVNRELAALRRTFSVAVQEGWLNRNPFNDGDALIDIAQENKRERIATRTEERALLLQCESPREHLKPFLFCAFDTGMRPGEIFRLERRDLNFETETITAISYKGKRMLERWLKMTPRLKRALVELLATRPEGERVKVFPMSGVRRSFATAKRLAGLEGIELTGFRLYDIRHTTTTRLIRGNMPLSEAGKLMGHTQPSTTWRYLNPDEETRDRAVEILTEDED